MQIQSGRTKLLFPNLQVSSVLREMDKVKAKMSDKRLETHVKTELKGGSKPKKEHQALTFVEKLVRSVLFNSARCITTGVITYVLLF
jgi:hypothetical protein